MPALRRSPVHRFIARLALTLLAGSAWVVPTPADAHPVSSQLCDLGCGLARVIRIDLSDPATVLDIKLPYDAPRANTRGKSYGTESFAALVARAHAAAMINGTYFSEDAQKRVMGNMVRRGKVVKYSPWDDAGTIFSLHEGNRPEMITPRAQGISEEPHTHWLSITAGPRLLRDGQIWLHPRDEGFNDPDIFGRAGRSALGYTRDGKCLLLVSFLHTVSLRQEAAAMQMLGVYQAMSFDGGSSQALAYHSQRLVAPARKLTNVLAVYDASCPANAPLRAAWKDFEAGRLAALPADDPGPKPGDRLIAALRHGETLAYDHWRFERAAAAPELGILNGTLAFAEGSYGEVFAPAPPLPPSYALEFYARLIDDTLSVYFDAAKAANGLHGLSLEYRQSAPSGLYLRHDGQLVASDVHWPVDKSWHRYQVALHDGKAEVFVDEAKSPVLSCVAKSARRGIGLSGRGEFRGLKLLAWHAPIVAVEHPTIVTPAAPTPPPIVTTPAASQPNAFWSIFSWPWSKRH